MLDASSSQPHGGFMFIAQAEVNHGNIIGGHVLLGRYGMDDTLLRNRER